MCITRILFLTNTFSIRFSFHFVNEVRVARVLKSMELTVIRNDVEQFLIFLVFWGVQLPNRLQNPAKMYAIIEYRPLWLLMYERRNKNFSPK